VAHILAAVAEAEREVIGQRTSAALLAKRERGEHVGRRSSLPAEVVERIVREREAGATLQAIADQLNADGVPTGQKAGGRWYRSTVRAVLSSQAADALQ
jgi:DNA invertase Pin-like site-specific DNA recombinase